MGKDDKFSRLYAQFVESRDNVSFTDLCKLAELVGFTFDRQGGSHRIYRHAKYPGIMNFQSVKGKAKPYQVKQLLAFIDEHKLKGSDE